MNIPPYIFRSFRICGIWYEDSSYLLLKILYSGFVGFVFINFLLSELIELMRMNNSVNEASEMLFASFNFISCTIKVLNFVSHQNDLQNLLKDFQHPICQSTSSTEEGIIKRYNDFLPKMFLGYCGLTLSTGLILTTVPLLGGEPQMPYKGYQVLNISESTGFGMACSPQFFAVFYVILMSTTLDAMAYGLMILATGQAELNCHRIVNSTMSLKSCIEHQVLISDTICKIQTYIIPAVVPQFFFSLTTLCTSIFLMSQLSVTDAEFTSFTLCFASMLSQVFFYCWFGNELKLKKQELTKAIYASNWINCNGNKRKNLSFVMLYAKHTMPISFHGQCDLSLNTFIWVAKTSYAAFNLLRGTETN